MLHERSLVWDSLERLCRLRAGAVQTRKKARGAHTIIPIAKCQDSNAILRLEKLLILSWMIICVHESDEPGSECEEADFTRVLHVNFPAARAENLSHLHVCVLLLSFNVTI